MATQIGVVKALIGEVTATGADGSIRTLQLGDRIFANELISTGEGGAVEIEFADGSVMDLGRNSQALLDDAMYDPSATSVAETALDEVPDDIAAIQQALLEGEDPTTVGEATAAGAGVEGGNEGHEPVFVDYLNPEVTPDAGFDTVGVENTYDLPEEDIIVLEEEAPNGFPSAGLNNEAAFDEDDFPLDDDLAELQSIFVPKFAQFESQTGLNLDQLILNALGNNDEATGDDVAVGSPITYSGSLNASYGPDGQGSLSFNSTQASLTGLTSGGETVNYVVLDDGLTIVGYHGNTGESYDAELVFMAILDPDTLTYSVTITDVLDHSDGDLEDNIILNFDYSITDSNGDSATGSIAVDIDDDSPLVDLSLESDEQSELPLSIVVDESVGTEGSVKDEVGLAVNDDETDSAEDADDIGFITVSGEALFDIDVQAGADGENEDARVFNLTLALAEGESEVYSGLDATDGGEIMLSINDDGTVVTGSDEDGHTVFTISIDTETGDVSVAQYEAIDHGSDENNHDSVLYITEGLVGANVTVYDNDGDSATDDEPVDIGSIIGFEDDGPKAQLAELGDEVELPGDMLLDESAAPDAITSVTEDFSVYFVTNPADVDFGSDGAGEADEDVLYKLVLSGEIESGLHALEANDGDDTNGVGQGAPILLFTNDAGEIEGKTSADSDFVYFTISVDEDSGEVTFSQSNNIWHDISPDNYDEPLAIDIEGVGTIKLVQTVTDADGDTDEVAINLAGSDEDGGEAVTSFIIEDDGPEADNDTDPDDTNDELAGIQGNVTSNDDYGTDGGEFQSWSDPVVEGQIVKTYGTLTANDDGSYTFVWNTENFPAPTDQDQPIQVSFDYTIIDNDGDTDTATLTFNDVVVGVDTPVTANIDANVVDFLFDETQGETERLAEGEADDGIVAPDADDDADPLVIGSVSAELSALFSGSTGGGDGNTTEGGGIDDFLTLTADDDTIEVFGTNLVASESDDPIYLVQTSPTLITAYAISDDDIDSFDPDNPGDTPVAMTITLTDTTVDIDQLMAVEHAETDEYDEGTSLLLTDAGAELSISANITIQDDQDVDENPANDYAEDDATFVFASEGTSAILIEDDGPVVSEESAPAEDITLQTDDADLSPDSDTTSFADAFSFDSDAGSDGEASNVTTYALSLGDFNAAPEGGDDSHVDSGLQTSNGDNPIYLYVVAGVVVGSISLTAPADPGDGDWSDDVVFTISVDNSEGNEGDVTLEQYAAIEHVANGDDGPEDYADDNNFADDLETLANDLVFLTATNTVTDNDGDTASADSVLDLGGNISFTDDGPTAVNDSDSVTEGNGNVADGNVFTGTGGSDTNNTDGSADDLGADDGTSGTAVTGAYFGAESDGLVLAPIDADGEVIAGTYGDLTLSSDGSYTYTLKTDSIPDDVTSETFTYEITDSDGDTDLAELTIALNQDLNIPEVNGDTETVYEDGLADGLQHGENSETTTTGSFTVDANDESYTLTLNGETVSAVNDTVDTGTGVLTITAISAPVDGVVTYSYSYTLSGNLTHSGQGEVNPITDTITMSVTDATGDSDPTPGEIVISIVDDIAVSQDVRTGFMVNEIGNMFTDNVDIEYGADGFGDAALSGSFIDVDGTLYWTNTGGEMLTAGDVSLLYVSNPDGSLAAVTDNEAAETIFTVTYDELAGTYSVNQIGELDGAEDLITIGLTGGYGGGNVGEPALFPSAEADNNGNFAIGSVMVVATAYDDPNTTADDDNTVNFNNNGLGVSQGSKINYNGDAEILVLNLTEGEDWEVIGNDDPTPTGGTPDRVYTYAATLSFWNYSADEVAYAEVYDSTDPNTVIATFTYGVDGTVNPDGSWTISTTEIEGQFDEIRISDVSDGGNGFGVSQVVVTEGGQGFDNTIGLTIDAEDGDGDTVTESWDFTFSGEAAVSGTSGDDKLQGNGESDSLAGGEGNDILVGGAGDDILNGGLGDDVLTGGLGADTFAWNSGDTGEDAITDFNQSGGAYDETEGDVLNLADVIGDIGGGDIADYISVTDSVDGAVIEISDTGDLVGNVTQTIVLEGVTVADLGPDLATILSNHTDVNPS